jgi:diguanylate cyclase (GGDEF)-like protein
VPHWVLCVDDDPSILAVLRQTIGTLPDVIVDIAPSAQAARERIEQQEYAVVIADHLMPEETGLALLGRLAARGSPIVRILLTAYADFGLSLEAINHGHVFALLEKPLEIHELLIAVRSAIERYELSRALREKLAELERTNTELRRRHEELQRAQAEVKRLEDIASTDGKTGATSYRFFVDRLEQEIARARRYERPLGLVLVDIDGFKAINDRFGHVVGDGVLRGVARLLRSSIRLMDVLARFGGDEFAIILPDTDLPGTATMSERLRVNVGACAFSPASAGELTLSIGLAALPHHDATSSAELIELADRALYRAKASGRNCCVIHGEQAN